MFLDSLKSGLARASNLEAGSISALAGEAGFKCNRCGWCCCPDPDYGNEIKGIRRPSNAISVFPEDIRAIRDATGLGWLDIVEPDIYSCIKSENIWAIGWIMKRKQDGTCWFFKEDENSCMIYNHRPLICRCYPFFLYNSGILEIRHCYGIHREMAEDDATELGTILIKYLIDKTENYIGIFNGLGKELKQNTLCEIKPINNHILHVFDGETTSVLEYSNQSGWKYRL